MTAVSLGAQRGFVTFLFGGGNSNSVTVGTNAPSGSFDFEFRWNQTDQNSKDITMEDILLAIEAFRRVILQTGGLPGSAGGQGGVQLTDGIIGPP